MKKNSTFLFLFDFEICEIFLYLDETFDDFLGMIFNLDKFGYIFLLIFDPACIPFL